MSFQKPPLGLGEDASVRGPPKKEQDFRGSAILHQQRRLKQAHQFVHKDSADLLPLDQLRRLGTSKDLAGIWDICVKLSTERQENLISKACVKRLGLQATNGPEEKLTVDIELGGATLTCNVTIVDDDSFEFCMGLETLISLKTCIDLEHGVLKTPTHEIPFMNSSDQRPGEDD